MTRQRTSREKRPPLRPVPALVAVAVGVAAWGAPAAQAASPIEGSWFFNNGEVLVEATGPGTFKGTVVRETQFSECPHQVGEFMWDLRATANPAVFEGGHNWLESSSCTILSPRGRAKWTIVSVDPQNFVLRFCTVPPEDTTSPPEDDPSGCDDLRRLRPPQPPPSFASSVTLPKQGKRRCRSRRNFRIHLRSTEADPLIGALVTVNGKLVKTVTREQISAPVDLRGLPKGRYRVTIVMKTASGKIIQGVRRYRTCARKRR